MTPEGLIPFPYPPDPTADFVDPIGFTTDITTARSQREQRVPLRAFPGGQVGFTVLQADPTDLATVNGYLWAHHADQFLVPLWPWAVLTAVDLNGGDRLIPCVAPAAGYGLEIVPFQAAPTEANPYLMLWTSPDNWQVLQFESLAIAHGGFGKNFGKYFGRATQTSPPAVVTIDAVQAPGGGGFGRAFGRHFGHAVASESPLPAGTFVIPLRVGSLDSDLAESLESLEAASGELRFTLQGTAD